jgi:hypothetical protein
LLPIVKSEKVHGMGVEERAKVAIMKYICMFLRLASTSQVLLLATSSLYFRCGVLVNRVDAIIFLQDWRPVALFSQDKLDLAIKRHQME